MPNETYICKVYENKTNKQKLVTIPKKSNIQTKDFVQVKKVEVK